MMWQVAHALAVAENALEFEHRDLHWGNVLVKATESKEVSFMVNGVLLNVPTRGVKVTIIDYTLSRLCKGEIELKSA